MVGFCEQGEPFPRSACSFFLSTLDIITYIDVPLCLQITFLEPSNKMLINADLKHQFRVPVVLGNGKNKDKIGNLITRNGTCPVNYHVTSFPFVCELHFDSPVAEVDVQDVFAVHQDFDIRTG